MSTFTVYLRRCDINLPMVYVFCFRCVITMFSHGILYIAQKKTVLNSLSINIHLALLILRGLMMLYRVLLITTALFYDPKLHITLGRILFAVHLSIYERAFFYDWKFRAWYHCPLWTRIWCSFVYDYYLLCWWKSNLSNDQRASFVGCIISMSRSF